MTKSRQIRALHIDETGCCFRIEETACEFPLHIILDGEELATRLCTPDKLEELTVGFLASKGIIRKREDIAAMELDGDSGIIRVRTSRGNVPDNRPAVDQLFDRKKIFSDIRITPDEALSLHRRFQETSELHRQTSAAHSAALCTTREILVLSEDIGRHNAIDKTIGRCLLEGIPTADRILSLSCRISSEIVMKAAMAKIPMLISKSGPTDRGVELAAEFGISLIGFIYKSAMNVYSAAERVKHGPLLEQGSDVDNGK
jgi:FdhD protein